MLALICAGSFGVCAHAEEASEHLMMPVNGAQIGGYVNTSVGWNPHPRFSFRETIVGEVPIRELRAPRLERPVPFNPLDLIPARLDGPETPPAFFPGRPRAEGWGVPLRLIPRTPNSSVITMPDQARFQLAAVPEPTTIGLTATGLLAWMLRRSRKK
jgi:hypothetical protein